MAYKRRRKGKRARKNEAIARINTRLVDERGVKRDVSESERLRHVMAMKHLGHGYAMHYEVGLNKNGRLRADIIAISVAGHISIGEVKSSVADFKKDTKWPSYIKYADRFHFILNEKTYAKVHELIPKHVGIFVVTDDNKVECRQRCKQREMSPTFRMKILARLAYRSATDAISQHSNALTKESLLKQELLLNLPKEVHAQVKDAFDKAIHKVKD